MIKRNQRGDTLVEVLISIAVIGMVIGASYATATRAQRTGRYAQEQTEALKVAEAQIEKLKHIATIDPTTVPAPADIFSTINTEFCITDTFAKVNKGSTGPSGYDANCKGLGSGKLYDVVVKYEVNPPDGGHDLFTVTVSWERVGSAIRGNQQIAYRLHAL